jgi:Methyltransferase FkbM domain
VCVCSSPDNAGRALPLHVAGPLSSLDRSGMAPSAVPERVIEVPVRTLDGILEEASAPAGFDFLSIDVEGHELDVLRGFDLARWRPRLILLEDHVADLSKHRYLQARGYRIVRRYENNGWYVPADADVPCFSRWEILRKYYLALPIRMLRNFARRLRRKIEGDVSVNRCRQHIAGHRQRGAVFERP